MVGLLPWIGKSRLQMMALLGCILGSRGRWRRSDRKGIKHSRGRRAHIASREEERIVRRCTSGLLVKVEEEATEE